MATPQEIGLRIEQRRKELGLTLNDVAETIGVARSTIQRYEKGKIEKIKLPIIEAIANVLKVNPSWIVYKTENPAPVCLPIDGIDPYYPTHRIPILGRIPAGAPMYADEYIEGYTYTDLNGGYEYFGLKVRGDSMDAAGIKDGYTVIVRRQDTVDNGQIAVVLIDGEDATLKRFSQNGNIVTLMPQSTNPIHQPFIFDLKDTHVDILGLVVRVEFSPV